MHKKIKHPLKKVYGIMTLISILLVSCGNNENDSKNAINIEGSFSSLKNMQNVLKVSLAGNPSTLDPQITRSKHTTQITSSIYDTLVVLSNDYEKTQKVLPSLAKSWTVSEDGLVWTFILREDVRFHDGTELDAKDVVSSFSRLKTLGVRSPFATSTENFVSIREGNITEANVETDEQALDRNANQNSLQLIITLDSYNPNMPRILASSQFSIMPSELIEGDHNFDLSPVGTGAYNFTQWTQQGIALTRNKEYFGAQSNSEYAIDALLFFITTSDSQRFDRLMDGTLDVIEFSNTDTSLAFIKEIEKQKKKFQILRQPSPISIVLALSTRTQPFDILENREFVTSLIDKEQIRTSAFPFSYPSDTLISIASPYYQNEHKEVLSLENNNLEPITESVTEIDEDITLYVEGNAISHQRAGLLLQSLLKSQKVAINMSAIPSIQWFDFVYGRGEFQMALVEMPLPLDLYELLKNIKDTGGIVGYEDDTFDAIVDEITVLRTSNDGKDNATALSQYYKDAYALIEKSRSFFVIGQRSTMIVSKKGLNDFYYNSYAHSYDFRRAILEIEKKN